MKTCNVGILQNLFSAAITLRDAQDDFNRAKMRLINDTELDNGLITLISRYLELQVGCNGCPSAASPETYARAILSINADKERLSGAPIEGSGLAQALRVAANDLKTKEGSNTI